MKVGALTLVKDRTRVVVSAMAPRGWDYYPLGFSLYVS